jgi:3-dehydro-4-phosphotetronate decarboxylase
LPEHLPHTHISAGVENVIGQAGRPTLDEIHAAARVLDKAGRFHHWWPPTVKTYDELATTDLIGRSEFDGIVERMLLAAAMVRKSR